MSQYEAEKVEWSNVFRYAVLRCPNCRTETMLYRPEESSRWPFQIMRSTYVGLTIKEDITFLPWTCSGCGDKFEMDIPTVEAK